MTNDYTMPRPMNPLLPPMWHIPDAEARTMPDGRLYLYGSCDGENRNIYCSREYHVFSTEDFRHWRRDGPSFRADDIPWLGRSGIPAGAGCFEQLPAGLQDLIPEQDRNLPMEKLTEIIRAHRPHLRPENLMLYAPDTAEHEGKYYLFFCLSDDTEGVAVSETPGGPFQHPTVLPALGIGPSVLMDTDGSAYLYWGQFSSSAARLIIRPDGFELKDVRTGVITEKEHHFHEGSSLRKIGDTYYYVFADISRRRPTCLGYATSGHPFGPFAYQGVIIDNADCDPETWNNHGCIAEYHGQWYVFYHRSSGRSRCLRRVCCEPISFDASGRIREVKMTSQGPGAPFAQGEAIPAYTACGVYGGAYTEEDMLYAPDGSSAVFRYVKGGTGSITFDLSGDGEGDISLLADGKTAGQVRLQGGKARCTVCIPEKAWELGLIFHTAQQIRLHSIALS